MINLRSLNNALELAEYGNFARAAKALNISQPTLSRSIQALERSVGEKLFDRGTKAVLPTQAGLIVLKHARLVSASYETMREEIDRHRGVLQGTISIGAGSYAGATLLPQAIGRFNQRYPNIEIRASIDDWASFPSKLLRQDYDFVIVESGQLLDSQEFELIPLDRHQAFFFCRSGHPLLEKDELELTNLSIYPLMFSTIPDRLFELFNRLFFPNKGQGSQVRNLNHILCDDQALIKSTVLHSDAIAVATFGMLAAELEAGLYSALPFRVRGLRSDYDIVKRKDISLSPSALNCIEILLEFDEEQSALETDLINSLGPEISV